MNPEHAKSLTPKHLKLNHLEIDRMRPETLASIMAKWPEDVSNYFRLKYADHQYLRPKIFEWLFEEIRVKAVEEDWPLGRLYKLIDLAIDEALVQGNCGACGGNGKIVSPARTVTCSRCHGSGRTRFTQHRRARQIGVKQGTWSRVWEERYQMLADRLYWAEQIITYRR